MKIADSYPISRFKILRMRKLKIAQNPRLSISQFNSTWNLHIKNVEVADSGSYMCTGTVLILFFLSFPFLINSFCRFLVNTDPIQSVVKCFLLSIWALSDDQK